MARSASAWDPAQYLQFANERLRPARDLLAQTPLSAPARVVDLGCGAGNVTAILQQRFPQAEVVGVDGSASMLEKARATVPQCRFERADFFQWRPAEPLDLIYSNAALQWVDRHPTLFPQLLSFLVPKGMLAVQMPAMHDTPLRRIPYDLAAKEPWAEYLSDISSAPAILSPVEYWDLLRPRVASLDMWQTTYMRMKVSGAKPRASRLNGLSAATDEVWEVRNDR
jgi:trans-aconitate 2-methyltransferase